MASTASLPPMQTPDANDEVAPGSHPVVESQEASKDLSAFAEAKAASETHQHLDADLADKIVRQVNFYFSDANLPSDNFLLKEVRKTPDGWGKLFLPCT